ncbi:UDP-N-acetylmuramate--L-alanine ligase [Sediminibacterium sp.]|uniref:UDP-N-acetylmuramate--L-alanine ligase n=1 Tax=Sediminibacterium sp. TaxID=1917865 RepID=UPI002736823C|nr:UDP-N-acetylmuramate--L-alanine ligase [Sediminibacterium sp.]MDP3392484.1 UDP-N-acetylmuramate--L-alanine ligase [Sediminibacterium sp.]MDP3565750.1 UDP-N-acetylmuramate--L-alanine ligase [Sediminibacterium sp.]
MSKLTTINNIYFIGVGGIGMSAIARYFLSKGAIVSGYDKTPTVLTNQLEKEGILIHYTDDISLAPQQPDVIVYTPAIPKDHQELNHFINNGFTVMKRSDILQWITENAFNICIAGTHGKTTVTSMVAHLLRHSGYGCNAFLGGISANYHTNFWSHERNVVVVEADEYDRSFLKLSPNIEVITSMDPDHLDIYGTAEEVEKAFVQFSQKLKPGGTIVAKYGLSRAAELRADHLFTYDHQNEAADIHVKLLQVIEGSYHFTVQGKNWSIPNLVLHMGGLHNIDNMIAAITVAKQLGIDDDKIVAAVADYKGVRRRFEYALKTTEHVLIDDYAHHPDELKALLSGVRSIFPDRKLTLVFQPHLFSRTKDQAAGFSATLDLADEVILLPIYPARELPMEGVNSEMLLNNMKLASKQVLSKTELLDWVKANKPSLLVMAGAGDIDTLVNPAKELLMNHPLL